jgi:hypothetical protein
MLNLIRMQLVTLLILNISWRQFQYSLCIFFQFWIEVSYFVRTVDNQIIIDTSLASKLILLIFIPNYTFPHKFDIDISLVLGQGNTSLIPVLPLVLVCPISITKSQYPANTGLNPEDSVC